MQAARRRERQTERHRNTVRKRVGRLVKSVSNPTYHAIPGNISIIITFNRVMFG